MFPITLTLCHGTDSEFQGFNFNECNECGAFGRGFYFSNDFELERIYSNGLDPVVAKVTMQNPYILDMNLPDDEYLAASRVFRPIEHARERIIGLGYDGVLLRRDSYVEAVAFYPRQIAMADARTSRFLINKNCKTSSPFSNSGVSELDSFAGTATPKLPIKAEISQYLGHLWRFGVVLSLDDHIAERLVEQTCIRALERDPLLPRSQRMDCWLFSILQSIWFDKHRSNCGRNGHSDINGERTADRGGDPYKTDGADLILHQVMALPDACRAAVFLTYVERMSYNEVAEVLALPIGTIMSGLVSARILLAESRGLAKDPEPGEVF